MKVNRNASADEKTRTRKDKLKMFETYGNKLFWFSIILVLVVTMTPGNGKFAGNYLDKVAHFLIFFFLSITVCYKFQKSDRLTEAIFWAILFGLITEVIQQFIPGRNMDLYDGIADTLGVIVGYYFYKKKCLKPV